MRCALFQLTEILIQCEGAYADRTLQSYRKDLQLFKDWCETTSAAWLPATHDTVARFVHDQTTRFSISTIKRRLCAIRFAHRMTDLPCPIEHSSVQLAIRRASRAKRRRPTQSLGLTTEILQQILAACPDDLRGLRDAALISSGYDTLCRSSELSVMRAEHLSLVQEPAAVFIPLSKSDPFGDGRIAYLSPATAERLRVWIASARIHEGPVFRGLHTNKVAQGELRTSSIRRLIKAAARRAKLDTSNYRL